MHRRACVTLLALAGASGCSLVPVVSGSGTIVESTPEVTPFDSVEVTAAFEVTLRVSDRHEVVLRTDDNLLELVEITVTDGRLSLGAERGVRHATLEAEMTVPADGLRDITLDAAASMTSIEPLTPDQLSLRASGASRAFLVVDVPSLDIEAESASVVNVRGTTETVAVEADGASTARLDQLEAENAEVDAEGASRVGLRVTGGLTARAEGASTIRYAGNPTSVDQQASGASSVAPQTDDSR